MNDALDALAPFQVVSGLNPILAGGFRNPALPHLPGELSSAARSIGICVRIIEVFDFS